MHLYKHVRIHQIFGANTDVGKTILSTALVRVSAQAERRVRYLKPVSTGPVEDADDEFVKRFNVQWDDIVQCTCLHRYQEPVSPHLALRLEPQKTPGPTDQTLVESVSSYIDECAQGADTIRKTDIIVETAGGVHSPSLNGTSQAETYRPLLLPTILIGDFKLGGISSTISSYESLVLRGYSVDSVLIFRDEYYRNWEYLSKYFDERGVHLSSFLAPPQRLPDTREDYESMGQYYRNLLAKGELQTVNEYLDAVHAARIENLHSLPQRALRHVWWPFVQHGLVNRTEDVTVIDSAYGDLFSTYIGHTSHNSSSKANLLAPQVDGSASWWTQTFGHAYPELTLAAAHAAGRYGHVIFPQTANKPAVSLAERLLSPSSGPGAPWASRVFFSDDGSTAMEVALKMALRAYCVRHRREFSREERRRLGVLGLRGSYHGDTLGAMDACDDSGGSEPAGKNNSKASGVYTCEWHDARGFWLDPPSVSIRKGKPNITLPSAYGSYMNFSKFDSPFGTQSPLILKDSRVQITYGSVQGLYEVERRLKEDALTGVYRDFIKNTLKSISVRLASLVLEPLIMGAGGMIFVDPLFQRVLVDVVRSSEESKLISNPNNTEWSGLPVIYDEVFTGLYRSGHLTCSSVLGTFPDISVYAKTLTGGLVPLAVTLASESIFRAFLSGSKADALLHGHSYTAHPVGCEVGNTTLSIMERMVAESRWKDMQRPWMAQQQSGSANSDDALTSVLYGDKGDKVAQASSPAKDAPKMWSFWSPDFVRSVSELQGIESVMTLGTVLAIKFDSSSEEKGYRSLVAQERLQAIRDASCIDTFGIHFRTLGDVAYFMTSLTTSSATVKGIEQKIEKALRS